MKHVTWLYDSFIDEPFMTVLWVGVMGSLIWFTAEAIAAWF